MSAANLNEYTTTEHALKYLALADKIPHRTEGEAVLSDFIPRNAKRILDLGTGDGRLLALLRIERRHSRGVALDFSPVMLNSARKRFQGDDQVQVVEHNLDEPLPALGQFDVIVSSFAIHHCTDERKRKLYSEIYAALTNDGVFCNLEHVLPGSQELHIRFLPLWESPRLTRIRRTSSFESRRNWNGCARSDLKTWTATGNGSNSL